MNTRLNRRNLLLAAAGLIAGAAGLVAGQTAQQHAHAATMRADAQPADTALARLAAAERVCDILHDQQDGASIPHQGVEHAYLWSLRRMEAQRRVGAARGEEDRASALRAHLERMRSLAQQVAEINKKAGGLSAFDVASTEFYVAEAQDLLAQAKGGRAHRDGDTP